MTNKVSAVLRHKGHNVVTVRPNQTALAVARTLTQHRIGAAPVVGEDGRLAGIISERDIIRAIAEHGEQALALAASSLMTPEVATCSPDDEIVALMQVMTYQRVRHIPVVSGDSLDGIVSIGDVVKQRLEEVQTEVEELRHYIVSS